MTDQVRTTSFWTDLPKESWPTWSYITWVVLPDGPGDQVRTPSGPEQPIPPEYQPDDPPPTEPTEPSEDDPATAPEPPTQGD